MENLKYQLNKKQSPIVQDPTINRLNKNNKIKKSKIHEDNDFHSVKTQTNIEFKKIKNERNLSNKKNTFLKHIKISDESQNLLKKTLKKNNLNDIGDLINNLKALKSYSINIKLKDNQLIANIDNSKLNKNNFYNRKDEIHSKDKVNKKTIEKEENYNNNELHSSCKTFNLNNNNNIMHASKEPIVNNKRKILKKKSHDTYRNIDNIDMDNFIQKYKTYKIVNKNIQKNNININLNINNIQNIQNIQNIETIDINKKKNNQKLFLIKNNILHSYIKCGKVYRDKIPQDKHFNTLQNYIHEKRNTKNNNYSIHNNINSIINSNNNRISFNSTNMKNKLNNLIDNELNKKNIDKKNLKLNYNILIHNTNSQVNDYLPKFSSIDTATNNTNKMNNNLNLKKNYNSNNVYNSNFDEFTKEFFENKTINNESIKNSNISKKNHFRVLTGKKKKFILFGQLIKKENNLDNINNLKNNFLSKLSNSKNKNLKTMLPKDLKVVINNFYNNKNKPKNYFNHKIAKTDGQNQVNNNFYTIMAKDNKNKNNINTLNLVSLPQEHGLKILLTKNKKSQEEKNKNKILNEKNNNDNIEKNNNLNDDIYINSKPEYVKEYNDEILINLLIEEYTFNKKKKLIINSEILTNYGINPNIRSCLIDSLIGLQDTFKFCDKTLFITIQIIDNYIGEIIALNDPNLKIEETDLDIILVACFLIASKMEESFIYYLTDYLSILSEKYNTSHLTNMEYNILKYYNFEVFSPNTLDFFEIFSSLYNIDDDTKKKGIDILIIILLNVDLSQIPSSVIAFSVLYLIMKKDFNTMMNKIDNLFYNLYKWSDWNQKNFNDKEKNETYSKYMKLISPLKKENDLKEISDMIIYFIENLPKNEFINISKKLENFKDSFLFEKNK